MGDVIEMKPREEFEAELKAEIQAEHEAAVDELPEDTARATIMVEEGIVMLNQGAKRAVMGAKMEAEHREKSPENDWMFSFVYLASVGANATMAQAHGVLQAAQREDIKDALSKQCKRALMPWKKGLEVCEKLVEVRGEPTNHDTDKDPAAIEALRDYLVTLMTNTIPKSERAMRQNARARARRVGPKRAALARAHATSMETRVQLALAGRLDVEVEGEATEGVPTEAGGDA